MNKIHKSVLLLLLATFVSLPLLSQNLPPQYYKQPGSSTLEFYTGPRMGATVFTGPIARDLLNDYGIHPVISQFGWQFEWRFSNSETGPSAAVELLPLIGGLEQGQFLPSLSAFMGVRFPSGFEAGVGPNLTVTGFGIVGAVGMTFKAAGVYWPVNFAVMPASDGVRFTLLVGFNIPR